MTAQGSRLQGKVAIVTGKSSASTTLPQKFNSLFL